MKKIRSITIFSLLVFALVFTSTLAYSAEYPNSKLLAAPADIVKNTGKWVLLDCRDKKAYDGGHIPGSISLGSPCAKILRDEKSRVFEDIKKYEEILGNAGIQSNKTTVVYADVKELTSATVGFWILEYLGHKDVRFLNGGIEEWQASGNTLETQETKLPQAKLKVNLVKNKIATTEEVLKIAKGKLRGIQLIDSRTSAEYTGTDVRAKRGGRIPNCLLNIPHTEMFDKATGKIKPMDEMEKIYGTLDKNKRTIPYCQTGTRSTLTYLVFRLMGFKDPANYDDSWIIWGNTEDLPIEK
ncbi:MAG: sulfurtransferase [Nitrospirae bacterium]|nr:sulfurtransferase [Nitrospirota bacterium]